MKKYIFAFFSMFILGCGNDTTSSTNDGRNEVYSVLDLKDCIKEMEGDIFLITQSNSEYCCRNGEWIEISSIQIEGSSSSKDSISVAISLSSCSEVSSSSLKKQESSSSVLASSSSYEQKNLSSVLTSSSSYEQRNSSSSKRSLSSSSIFSSSSYFLMEDPTDTLTAWDFLNPEFVYGEFVDERDNQVYKTIKIGSQIWMAQNLSFPVNPGVQSWCFVNKKKYCNRFGYLYTWAAAIDSTGLANDLVAPRNCGDREKDCNLPAKWRGVCPNGWHLPSLAEFDTLFNYTGGRKTSAIMLRAKKGWYKEEGYDNFGFSALPAGHYTLSSESFSDAGGTAFWSTKDYTYDEKYNSENAKVFSIDEEYKFASIGNGSKHIAYSVRCIRDEASNDKDFVDDSDYDEQNNKLTDFRDGHIYKTMEIGNQIWMAENLNYNTNLRKTDLILGSRCYNDSLEYCDRYGRLYKNSASLDSIGEFSTATKGCGNSCSTGDYILSTSGHNLKSNIRGICPAGWHLPNKLEWETIIEFVGGQQTAAKELKSDSDWVENGNGFDTFGFTVLPAGGYEKKFYGIGNTSIFYAVDACIRVYAQDDSIIYSCSGTEMKSVRCVKN